MGIDYGRGLTNIDVETGIRYGVLPFHEVMQAWCDESAPYYACDACDVKLKYLAEKGDDDDADEFDCNEHDECSFCAPVSFFVKDDEYVAEQSQDDADIFVLKSPYYTKCNFCSPCAPGAGYLTDNGDDCKAYCFGQDWFDEDQPCPYVVYDVKTDEIVYSPKEVANVE